MMGVVVEMVIVEIEEALEGVVDGENQWLPVGAYISFEFDGITLCSTKAPSVTGFEYSATPAPN
jgi:hypothetical protein